MTAAAPTTSREVFPEVDVPARLIINKIDVRAEIPYLFTAASAAGSSTAAPYPDDYYRRERLPASTGGHDMSAGHAPSTGGGTSLWTIGGWVLVVLAVLWVLNHSSFSVNVGGSTGSPPAVTATPSGQPYRGPVSGETGIKYTGKSCIRNDRSTGREGYGPGGLGCWRY